jgi:hypothetical protein
LDRLLSECLLVVVVAEEALLRQLVVVPREEVSRNWGNGVAVSVLARLGVPFWIHRQEVRHRQLEKKEGKSSAI